MRKTHRKTRIIATLGPASDTPQMIRKLLEAGVDVFRLNMSHGTQKNKADLIKTIRQVEREWQRPVAIMADMQGPKLRIGEFENGHIVLKDGATFILDQDETLGNGERVQLPHPELYSVMKKGIQILLDDGKIRLEVLAKDAKSIKCKVMVGGKLSDRKGVNVPNAILPLAALTEKDRKDLDFALAEGVDWIALSFVQRPEDVAEARAVVKGRAGVLAKIEKPAALQHLDEILDLADAVMVARGDLGVEMPLEEVPSIQKRIIKEARQRGKPVVVATQMLESMITAPVPTRAEVSDIANAVYDEADAVMLSAESAAGSFPLESVRVMNKVARQVEGDSVYIAARARAYFDQMWSAEDAITASAKQVAESVNASTIVTFTTSGSTAIRAARERPNKPILALTPREDIARRLSLVWGLYAVKTKDVHDFEEMIEKSKRMALRHNLAAAGDRIVVTAGVPFGTPGATNVLHIAWISGNEIKKR